jgi:hypothetical protein
LSDPEAELRDLQEVLGVDGEPYTDLCIRRSGVAKAIRTSDEPWKIGVEDEMASRSKVSERLSEDEVEFVLTYARIRDYRMLCEASS